MKVDEESQVVINDFFRNYVDRGYKNPMNSVRLNKDHTDAHRRTIFEVCNSLLSMGIPFWTEVRLTCGCIPDVVCPTHVKPFIEVLSSESEEDFLNLKLHKYPSSLRSRKSFILVDAKIPFKTECIL